MNCFARGEVQAHFFLCWDGCAINKCCSILKKNPQMNHAKFGMGSFLQSSKFGTRKNEKVNSFVGRFASNQETSIIKMSSSENQVVSLFLNICLVSR